MKKKPLSARSRAARLNHISDQQGIWIRNQLVYGFRSSFGEVLVRYINSSTEFPFPGAVKYEDVLVDVEGLPLPKELFDSSSGVY